MAERKAKATTKETNDGLAIVLTSAEKAMYNTICEEGMVTISVGSEEQKKKGGFADVGINGIFWRIKFGAEYTVPKAVARLLDEGKYTVSVKGAY